MFITSREKLIIDLVMKTSGKHTPHSLASYLNVSVRTIQRDLKAVENILKPFVLQLNRTTNDGLIIDGKNEHIFKLMQQLSHEHPTDETPEEKKLQLLIKLLHEGSFFKKQVLAKELGVSVTTLASYLDDLTDWLAKFTVELTRKRGVGVSIAGGEANMRKALATYFLFHFHEELLENLYILQKNNKLEGPVLSYFSPDYLLIIDDMVHHLFDRGQTRLADNDYLGLIIHIAITIQRVENQLLLEEEVELVNDESAREFQLISQLGEELKSELSILLTKRDIHYLAVILKGSKLQDSETVDYDSIMLGQIIKNIIQSVSNQLHVDLSRDFSLFQGLLAHMEPSIFRLKHQMGLFNPLTGQIKKKYPVLFMAVRNSLEKEFPDISFPDDEIAFIVLHFGSALLMNEERATIHAVIVCPTGIGTSKMLASRIQKEFTEINSVEIKSMKEIEKSNLDEFDVVISTVRLPFDDVHYILVSPLLNDEDIQMIRSFLQSNIQQLTSKNEYVKDSDKEVRREQSTLQDMLQEMKEVQTSIEAILHNLRVYRKSNADYKQVLKEMVDELEQKELITDTTTVLQKLEYREKIGGLGIPDTNMGLYHCRDSSIHELIFQICHLEQPCVIQGMDGKEVHLKNLLLMLSPEKLSLKEQEILSLISTSLIENDAAMMIFSSSSEAMIRGKLEGLFSDYLQNKWIKE
ncbi:mannitol operon transcriptional antiterminator [Gracilibacillus orientalis]|uniref:Mannitol operon transcriptional antiterminator n=1 Tax=Gracilibacillus orientalis TaxID=334253 RepID=A0A1I4Q401_9BACI|nr:BglG family transcription antiterminator [Gracilibacillus orientalis]SFM34828.1 mannitol operon transcriptional antiterminator [Gracilibacillus orientalis]